MVHRTVPTHSHPHQKLTTEVPLKSPLKHAPPALMSNISPKLHSWHRNLFRILRHVVGKSKRPAEAFPCSCPCLQPTGDWIKDAQKGKEMSSTDTFKCFPHCPQARWCSSVVQEINTWPIMYLVSAFDQCSGLNSLAQFCYWWLVWKRQCSRSHPPIRVLKGQKWIIEICKCECLFPSCEKNVPKITQKMFFSCSILGGWNHSHGRAWSKSGPAHHSLIWTGLKSFMKK